jgi:hypothetical protein
MISSLKSIPPETNNLLSPLQHEEELVNFSRTELTEQCNHILIWPNSSLTCSVIADEDVNVLYIDQQMFTTS